MLVAVLSGLALVLGRSLGGRAGLAAGLLVALAMNAAAFYRCDRMALRSMRAYPVSEAEHPELCRLVRELAITMRLPIPAVYVSPTKTPNAFTTGRNPRRSAVCVTEGLLDLLDPRELRAVLGHELGHVANRDILVSSVAAALASMIMYAAQFAWLAPTGRARGGEEADGGRNGDGSAVTALALLVLGPVAALLLQAAVTRTREYSADQVSARITGDPLALAGALRKLETATRRHPLPAAPELRSTAALMIANPFHEKGFVRAFSTHPSTQDRIARLEHLAGVRR
ncbi:M48 family metalloprotease [Actinopolymorpha singaporensis]|uniref:Protease HtpX homolog n=1 Tax=Actinopolymorpha singaporensis TaxID=117157 RepID=A0A1H1QVH9_9ACTN|nr:M48 family metalloprotease [Actinopolymorpha singaporensis]SDS27454.1 Heat shock protein. Metallo peptidase. MEROPS family M48B [Actinopolymorpha singaporensis]